MMPGVIMATECKAFDKLYQLAEIEEPSITVRVQRLLMLLPTDPDVQEALESIGQQVRRTAKRSVVQWRKLSTENTEDKLAVTLPYTNFVKNRWCYGTVCQLNCSRQDL